MAHPMGESKAGVLRLDFDRRLKVEFHGSKVTSDAVPAIIPCSCSTSSAIWNGPLYGPATCRVPTVGATCWSRLSAEVAVPRKLFRKILSLIDDLRPRPAPA